MLKSFQLSLFLKQGWLRAVLDCAVVSFGFVEDLQNYFDKIVEIVSKFKFFKMVPYKLRLKVVGCPKLAG